MLQNSYLISLLSASIGTLIVSLAFLYLYIKEKHGYLFIWFLAWIVYALRFLIITLGGSQSSSLPLLYTNQLLSLINGILLLMGTRLFIRKGVTRSFWFLVLPSFLWFPLGTIMKLNFYWLTIPIFLLLGIIFFKIGLDFIRYRPAPYLTRWGIGLTLIVWGIHKMDYPFLVGNPDFAPIGFTLGFFLELSVAIGMVLLHYEMNKKLLQQAEEERMKMEQRLHQSAKLQALGQMAGGVAHDFNNQLAGIMGNAELCREECGDSPLAREYLDQIIAASRRSADLILQLLVFARKGIFHQEVLSIHSVIHDVLQMLKRSISKKVILRTEMKAREDRVLADRSHIHNALLNIALNGCDAMPTGGTLTLRSENDREGKNLIVVIADTGIGMDTETKARILEPFFTTKPTGHGIGMGLPAAYGTIKKLGGELQIESLPGKGSEFIITLPLKEKEVPARATPDHENEQNDRKQGGLNIMVVDDESTVLSMITRQLERLGHHPLSFNDPLRALDHYLRAPGAIDLVISDLMMPGLNGFELIMKMQTQDPTLRAIICSGYGDPMDKEDCSRSDLLIIRKPFTMSVLQEGIARLTKDRGAGKIKG